MKGFFFFFCQQEVFKKSDFSPLSDNVTVFNLNERVNDMQVIWIFMGKKALEEVYSQFNEGVLKDMCNTIFYYVNFKDSTSENISKLKPCL